MTNYFLVGSSNITGFPHPRGYNKPAAMCRIYILFFLNAKISSTAATTFYIYLQT